MIDKIIELFEKGYCNDCNELNCLGGEPSSKIVAKAIKKLQQENETLKQTHDYDLKMIDEVKRNSAELLQENRRLKEQLKQRDEVIDEAINKCELEIRASSYQYEKNHKQQELCYKVAHERIMEILNKYKGDKK